MRSEVMAARKPGAESSENIEVMAKVQLATEAKIDPITHMRW